jgi:hypothetical protein
MPAVPQSLRDLIESANFQPQAFLSDLMAASLRGEVPPTLAKRLGDIVQRLTDERAAEGKPSDLPITAIAEIRRKLLAILDKQRET